MDSDISNADAQLHVEFYVSERKPHVGVPFVRIMIPGDKTNIFDQPVKESHKQRFPRQWLYFQQSSGTMPSFGTSLDEWQKDKPDDLTEGQIEELKLLRFQTAEQMATATDAQLQRIMGGVGLRLKAQAYLRTKARGSVANMADMDELKKQLAEQQKQIAALLAKAAPGKPGRKPRSATAETSAGTAE